MGKIINFSAKTEDKTPDISTDIDVDKITLPPMLGYPQGMAFVGLCGTCGKRHFAHIDGPRTGQDDGISYEDLGCAMINCLREGGTVKFVTIDEANASETLGACECADKYLHAYPSSDAFMEDDPDTIRKQYQAQIDELEAEIEEYAEKDETLKLVEEINLPSWGKLDARQVEDLRRYIQTNIYGWL